MEQVLLKQQVLPFLLEHLMYQVVEVLLAMLLLLTWLFLLKALEVYWEHGVEVPLKLKRLQDLEGVGIIT
jgi:hypothetical protein